MRLFMLFWFTYCLTDVIAHFADLKARRSWGPFLKFNRALSYYSSEFQVMCMQTAQLCSHWWWPLVNEVRKSTMNTSIALHVKLMHVQGELHNGEYIMLKSSIHPKQKGLLHLVRREQLLVFKHAQLQCLVMTYRHCMDMQYKKTHSFHN